MNKRTIKTSLRWEDADPKYLVECFLDDVPVHIWETKSVLAIGAISQLYSDFGYSEAQLVHILEDLI